MKKRIKISVLKKTVLKILAAAVLGCGSLSAQAALVNGQTVLSINPGAIIRIPFLDPATGKVLYRRNGVTPITVPKAAGSYFTMGGAKPVNGVMLSEYNGILLGKGQPAGTASHGGAPVPGDSGAVTAPWTYFGQSGHEFTANNGVTVQSQFGSTAVLDFSNWRVTWNGIPAINMGGGKTATMSCWGDSAFTLSQACDNGSYYTLNYAAIVPPGSNFAGVGYKLHLEGSISAVPIPAAVWLLGSGLLGLLGVARRKSISG